MDNKELARVVGRYIGCECQIDMYDCNVIEKIAGYFDTTILTVFDGAVSIVKIEKVHLILRSINKISEEELAEIIEMCSRRPQYSAIDLAFITKETLIDSLKSDSIWHRVVDKLRGFDIDCDGLIESGVAIEKPCQNQ